VQAQPIAAAALLPDVAAPQSRYRQCPNPDGAVYPVRIERTRLLPSGGVDGKPVVRKFSQKECQELSAKHTARENSRKAPAPSRCQKNALAAHRAITKAVKDKLRAKVPKNKGKTRS